MEGTNQGYPDQHNYDQNTGCDKDGRPGTYRHYFDRCRLMKTIVITDNISPIQIAEAATIPCQKKGMVTTCFSFSENVNLLRLGRWTRNDQSRLIHLRQGLIVGRVILLDFLYALTR